MGFKTAEGKFEEMKDFLIRLKLSSKVAAASKIKAEGLLVGHDPKNDQGSEERLCSGGAQFHQTYDSRRPAPGGAELSLGPRPGSFQSSHPV